MKHCLSAMVASLTLAGCAHVPTQTDSVQTDGLSFEQRRAALEALPGWEMRGRLAVDTGERAYQARFLWRQQSDRLLLSLRGPFGAGAVEISGSDDALTVRRSGEQYDLADPETQLSEMLGWWLPVASLNDWLLGLPDRLFAADSEAQSDGTLSWLEQRLWRLDYVAYERSEEWLLPRRIEMNHERLHLRLTVDTWRPVTASGQLLN